MVARSALGAAPASGRSSRCRRRRCAALRRLRGERDAWRSIDLPDRVAGELRAIMNTYFANLLGRPPPCVASGRVRRAATAEHRHAFGLLAALGAARRFQAPTMPWSKSSPTSRARSPESRARTPTPPSSRRNTPRPRPIRLGLLQGRQHQEALEEARGPRAERAGRPRALAEADSLFREAKYAKAIHEVQGGDRSLARLGDRGRRDVAARRVLVLHRPVSEGRRPTTSW
jgi:hypothetical protein